MTSIFIPIWPLLLNSTLVYTMAYSTSQPDCLINILNLTCPKQLLIFLPKLTPSEVFSISFMASQSLHFRVIINFSLTHHMCNPSTNPIGSSSRQKQNLALYISVCSYAHTHNHPTMDSTLECCKRVMKGLLLSP